MEELIRFSTDDGVEIVGTYRKAPNARGAALLLHMMPATKESWGPFAALLALKGLSSLAIDLRGHGGSTTDGKSETPIDYRAFKDEEHHAKRLDVEAALRWLLAVERFSLDKVVLAGASIGANLAIWALAAHPQCQAAAALSPGINYRGLLGEELLSETHGGQHILLAASEDDAYAFDSARELSQVRTPAAVEVSLFKDIGHGTAMFERDPAFMEWTASWLASKL